MAHQIKKLMVNKNSESFTSVVQADETFIVGIAKNKHEPKRESGTKGRSNKSKTPMFGIVD